jgi:hypothetical protein
MNIEDWATFDRRVMRADRWLTRVATLILIGAVIALAVIVVRLAEPAEGQEGGTAHTTCEKIVDPPRLVIRTAPPYYRLDAFVNVFCRANGGYRTSASETTAWIRSGVYGEPWRMWSDARTNLADSCGDTYCGGVGSVRDACDLVGRYDWVYQTVVVSKVYGASIYGVPFLDTRRWYSTAQLGPCGRHQ